MPRSSVIAIAAAGFAAAVGQVLILRELMVLFCGNELSSGFVLAAWLLWTALGSGMGGVVSRRFAPWPAALSVSLLVLGVLLPLTMLFVRASRIIWSIPTGEIVSPGVMFGVSILSTALFCMVSGFIFALAWRVYEVEPGEDGHGQPIFVYVGEAAGAGAGGLVFYLFLLPRVSAFSSALLTAGLLILAAFTLFSRGRSSTGGLALSPAAWSIPVLVAVVALLLGPQGDQMSRRWQWGPNLITARDTPYHNLALVKNESQFSLFSSGLWLFSVPDPQSSEYAVHPAMLQHPDPRSVLLVGGGASGLVEEILKHPSVNRVDCVEPDPQVSRLAGEYLPSSLTSSMLDERVHLAHTDAVSFIRSSTTSYDVVLLNVGDPMNAEVNRFYTAESFRKIREILKPAGVFSFSVSSAPDIIGHAQARLLKSLDVTLRSVFTNVLIYPGEQARFFAGDELRDFVRNPVELVRRIEARSLDLEYVREYYLISNLNPMRLEYMDLVLRESKASAVNRDFEPTCYFNHLIVWATQLHPSLARALEAMAGIARSQFLGGLAIVALLVVCLFFVGRPKPDAAVALSVAVAGGALMALEIVLLLSFQVLAGFLYTQLALIIAAFMVGMALGGAVTASFAADERRSRALLPISQAVLCVYMLGVLKLLFVLQERLNMGHTGLPPLSFVFSIVALAAGLLGGLHFSFAVKACAGNGLGSVSARTAGKLYAWDLAGAASGSVLASLFLLPVYGLVTTVTAFALLVGGVLPVLLRRW